MRAHQPEQQAAGADQEQQCDEAIVHGFLGRVTLFGVALQFELEQTQCSPTQQDAAAHTQQLGQAGQVIGCRHLQGVVVQRGHTRGGKAEQESVKSQMMRATSCR